LSTKLPSVLTVQTSLHLRAGPETEAWTQKSIYACIMQVGGLTQLIEAGAGRLFRDLRYMQHQCNVQCAHHWRVRGRCGRTGLGDHVEGSRGGIFFNAF